MANEPTDYDLNDLIQIDINTTIDPSPLSEALSSPPFIPIHGIINLRDLGAIPSSPIRRNLLYRSGALHNLSPSSITGLKDDLAIKMILDLRSDREIVRSPDPIIKGVKNLHFESLKVPSAIDMERFVENDGKEGYVEIYEEVLEIHRPNIRAALEWVRDEGTPMLFHCTAGKDRTGVLAALLLALAGASKDVIAFDYALTRVGIEPARELLVQMLKMWNKEWTAETPGMAEFSSVKKEFIVGTLDMMELKYGGVEGYVKSLGFGEGDLEKIKGVLRGG